jgi:succinate dehydrogenase / fumarate reductase membrane anchor subunit
MSAPGLQGLRPWIMQRISAVYIALSLGYFTICLLLADAFSASTWLAWVANPFNNIALGLFLLAVLWHAWIGVRDVVLDYLPNVMARILALSLVGLVLLGSALWGLKALFMVAIK